MGARMGAIAPEAFEPTAQLSPTVSYYLRKIVRSQVVVSSVAPTADLTTVLRRAYEDPQDFATACYDLERLVRYHQALSSQTAEHPAELEKTERDILRILETSKPTKILPTRDMVIVRLAEQAPSDHLQTLLQQRGYQVENIRPGHNVLAQLHGLEPDGIVIDVLVPEQGLELAQELLRDRQLQWLPLMLLSHRHSVSDQLKALKIGITDYIIQPAPAEEVLIRLENQLQRQRYRTRLEQCNRELRLQLQEQAHSQALLLAQEVVNGRGDYILFINRANQIVHANAAACEHLGYESEDLTALSVEFLDTHLAPEDWQTIWGHLQQHTSLNLKSIHHHQSGELLSVSLEFQYITLHGQEYSCIVATAH